MECNFQLNVRANPCVRLLILILSVGQTHGSSLQRMIFYPNYLSPKRNVRPKFIENG